MDDQEFLELCRLMHSQYFNRGTAWKAPANSLIKELIHRDVIKNRQIEELVKEVKRLDKVKAEDSTRKGGR